MIIMSSSSEIKTPTLEYKPPVELIASRFVDIINTINAYSQKFGSIGNYIVCIEDIRKVSAGILLNERTPTQIKQLYNICDTIQELRNIITRDSEIRYNALPKSLREEQLAIMCKKDVAREHKNTGTLKQLYLQEDIFKKKPEYQHYLAFNKHYIDQIEHFKKNFTFNNQTELEHFKNDVTFKKQAEIIEKASEPKEEKVIVKEKVSVPKVVIKEKDPVIAEEVPVSNIPASTNSIIDDSTDLLLLDLNAPSVPAPFIPEMVTAEPDTEKALHNRKKNIPKHIKTMVWNVHVGVDKLETKCFSCRAEKIDARHFQCGHVIAEAKGGDLNIKNLRPICQPCNASMGTQSMNEFTQEYFGWNVL